MFKNVAAVLFDLDGTLIDSAPDLGAAADRLRTDRGLQSLPLQAYRPLAGTGARGMLSVAFGITPDHPDFPDLREEFFTNYERCIHERTDVFAGVPELVATLTRRSLKWGVVTNKMTRFTSLIAQRVALFGSAGAIVSGDSTPYSKPHPAPLLAAADRLGAQCRGPARGVARLCVDCMARGGTCMAPPLARRAAGVSLRGGGRCATGRPALPAPGRPARACPR